MNGLEFLNNIDSEAPRPVYVLCPYKHPRARNPSYEPVLAQRIAKELVDRFVDASLKDLAYSHFHGDESDVKEIVETAETFPFLAPVRVIVVSRAEQFETGKAAEHLLRYIESPSEYTRLILICNSLDRRQKFFKTCEKHALLLECAELKEHEVSLWVNKEVENKGKTIEPSAVKTLVARAGLRLGDVLNAVNVVCDYVGSNERIRSEDVEAACADVAEEEVWALTDAIAHSETGKAIRCLRQLLELGKHEMEIMGLINWLLKTAYAVATGEGAGKLPQFQVKNVRPLAEKLGPRKLRDAFSLCMEAEVMLRTTGVNNELALELLVANLAAPRRSSQPSAQR
ncbi:MAG: DNA polymerase III subunit delta [Candidatus Hydrogenedentota bacterium]